MNNKTLNLDINGATIYCQIKGSGTLVLLIHGAVCDSDFFEDTAEILAKNHLVISYDRRGYSRSDGEIDGDFLWVEALDAAAVIKKIVPDTPVVVVGCSTGALLAMKLANLFPELVSLLILHEPPMTAFLPEDSEVLKIAAKANEFIARGRYMSAANRFLLLMEDSDMRAKPKPEEVTLREAKNMMFFIKNEFLHVFSKKRPPEIPETVPAVICVGDARADYFIRNTAQKFSKECGIPLVYFPGLHNCAYELPMEFAVGVEGIIKVWNTI